MQVYSPLVAINKTQLPISFSLGGAKYVFEEELNGTEQLHGTSPNEPDHLTQRPLVHNRSLRCVNNHTSFACLYLPNTSPAVLSPPDEHGGELMICLPDCEWSEVLNLEEAPSKEAAVTVRLASSSSNIRSHIGISWAVGLGKYSLSKVITFAPRYVIKNELSEELIFREGGMGDASNGTRLPSNQSTSILYFAEGCEPSLSLRYTDTSRW